MEYLLSLPIKNDVLYRQVTLFEELLLLKDFEKRENMLADRVAARQQEKIDMQNKVHMKYEKRMRVYGV